MKKFNVLAKYLIIFQIYILMELQIFYVSCVKTFYLKIYLRNVNVLLKIYFNELNCRLFKVGFSKVHLFAVAVKKWKMFDGYKCLIVQYKLLALTTNLGLQSMCNVLHQLGIVLNH